MTSLSTYGSYQQLPQPQETQGNKQNRGCPWHQGSLGIRYKCVFVSLTCLKAGALKFPYWAEVKGNKNKNPGGGVRTDAIHPRESQDPCRGRPGDTTPRTMVRIFPRLKGLKPYVRDEHFWKESMEPDLHEGHAKGGPSAEDGADVERKFHMSLWPTSHRLKYMALLTELGIFGAPRVTTATPNLKIHPTLG